MNISTDISLVKMGRKQWQPPHRPNGSSVGKSRSHTCSSSYLFKIIPESSTIHSLSTCADTWVPRTSVRVSLQRSQEGSQSARTHNSFGGLGREEGPWRKPGVPGSWKASIAASPLAGWPRPAATPPTSGCICHMEVTSSVWEVVSGSEWSNTCTGESAQGDLA